MYLVDTCKVMKTVARAIRQGTGTPHQEKVATIGAATKAVVIGIQAEGPLTPLPTEEGRKYKR